MKLAVDSYAGLELFDEPGRLDLSWTSDERDALEPELSRALETVLSHAATHIGRYPVDDPFGSASLAPVIARRFGLEVGSFDLVCGAGVGALVATVARAFAHRRVAVLGKVYPDLPAWLSRLGTTPEILRVREPTNGSADVVFLEHPPLCADDEAIESNVVARLCGSGFEAVVVDESNGNYLPASASFVGLVPFFPNLVVLRGVSKAYGMGGLRFGCAVGGKDALSLVRNALPPLQVASLSSAAAGAILALPDTVEARLRVAVAAAKREALALLAASGLPKPIASHASLPYVLYDPDGDRDHREAVHRLARHGIVGKRHMVFDGQVRAVARYSAPMRPERRRRLAALLAGEGR